MTVKFPPVDIRGAMAGQETEADVLADNIQAALAKTSGYRGPIVMWGLGGRHERHKDGSISFTPFSETTEEDMP